MHRHTRIFLGMLIGLLLGLWLNHVRVSAAEAGQPAPVWYAYAVWWLDLLGPTLFIGALNMLIAPLIFASIFSGVTSLPDLRELGAVGWKTLTFYLLTTSIAVVLGLALVMLIQPGKSAGSQRLRQVKADEQAAIRAEYEQKHGEPALDANGRPRPAYLSLLALHRGDSAAAADADKRRAVAAGAERTPGKMIRDDLVKPLLMNPFESLTKRNTLGIIAFSLLLALACTVVGARAAPLVSVMQALDAAMLTITQWIMAGAPLAVGALIAKFVAESNPRDLFESLAWYSITILVGLFLQIGILLAFAAAFGVGPVRMLRGFAEALLVGIGTSSSIATLPVSIQCVIQKLKVSPKIANFAMPLGATVNMNGTALYEGIAVAFLIQMFAGLDDVQTSLSAFNILLIFITAVLAAVGAAGVPSSGLVTMALVATAVHLPTYYIGIIFTVDALLDRFRTIVNIFGDAVGAVVVNRIEGERLERGSAPAQ
jgi:solute carrier family 1 (high affinity glutamate transporter) protein 1